MKRKLIASALSLALAFILMTSASFAWFTVSTAPEIAKMDVDITATTNLEIAKATTNLTSPPNEVTTDDHSSETNWGARISSFSGHLEFPATATNAGIQTVHYDAAGRTTGLINATSPTSFTEGVGYWTADVTTDTNLQVAVTFGIWLRSNVDCKDGNEVTCSFTNLDNKWGVQLLSADGSVLTGNKVALDKNTPTAVQVVMFLDGDKATASDIANPASLTDIKLQFSSTAVTGITKADGSKKAPFYPAAS